MSTKCLGGRSDFFSEKSGAESNQENSKSVFVSISHLLGRQNAREVDRFWKAVPSLERSPRRVSARDWLHFPNLFTCCLSVAFWKVFVRCTRMSQRDGTCGDGVDVESPEFSAGMVSQSGTTAQEGTFMDEEWQWETFFFLVDASLICHFTRDTRCHVTAMRFCI